MTQTMARPRSVVRGQDQQCLQTLIDLHACVLPEVLDVTYGKGRMWRGLADYQPLRNDVDERLDVDWHYDFRELPEAWTDGFDVVVFDPPGITEAGKGSRYYGHFGVEHPELQHAADNSHLFAPFLAQAVRVLRPKGIIVAKIGDQVHRGRYRWQGCDFVNADAATPGLVACDLLIKEEVRAETLVGHNWANVRHSRRAHIYFFCVRKGRC